MSHDEKSLDKEEEKILKSFDYYHGFLPREDLGYLLRTEGDYLLRVSEVENADASKNRREIILSVFAEPGGAGTDSHMGSVMGTAGHEHSNHDQTRGKIKNVIVRRIGAKYVVENVRLFDTLKELIEHYQTNFGQLNKVRFILRNKIRLQKWEFLHVDVKLDKLLGEGAFGEVRAGTLRKGKNTIEVAVKLTKGTGDLCKAKIKEMMKEARLMRNFRHRNIVRIYGVAVDEQPLYIILELVKGGGLNTYLKKTAGLVTLNEKLQMVYGAACGIEYLHRQECIHRDLAARNCLYTDDKVIKISDFGLSRVGSVYVIKTAIKLPIKWLAPETITTFSFSLKTDVYSYGVMCYEIFADGGEPWDNNTNAEVKKMVTLFTQIVESHTDLNENRTKYKLSRSIIQKITSGKCLTLSSECPEKLRSFITEKIFATDPNKRVGMMETVKFLDGMMSDMGCPPLVPSDQLESMCESTASSPASKMCEVTGGAQVDSEKRKPRKKGFHNKDQSNSRHIKPKR